MSVTPLSPPLVVPDHIHLGFDHTVPRGLVHRAAVGEVLLTDSAAIGEHRFLAAGQLPRGHSLFGDRRWPYHDPLMLIEAGRQAGVLIAHSYYGVPPSFAFIFRKLELRLTDPDVHRSKGQPSQLILDVDVPKRHSSNGQLTGIDISYTVAIDGVTAATMRGSVSFLSQEMYRDLREQMRAAKQLEEVELAPRGEAIDPLAVGRLNPRNVVLTKAIEESDREATYQVIVDEGHPLPLRPPS